MYMNHYISIGIWSINIKFYIAVFQINVLVEISGGLHYSTSLTFHDRLNWRNNFPSLHFRWRWCWWDERGSQCQQDHVWILEITRSQDKLAQICILPLAGWKCSWYSKRQSRYTFEVRNSWLKFKAFFILVGLKRIIFTTKLCTFVSQVLYKLF